MGMSTSDQPMASSPDAEVACVSEGRCASENEDSYLRACVRGDISF